MSELYKRIDNLCKKHQITITQMCKESGASRGSLSDLANDRIQTLSSPTIRKIANFFGCSPDYLIGDTLSLDFVPHEKEDAILVCPECGDEYIHFIKTKPVEFGSEKSDGIAIEFRCECGYEFYYVIETYKGNSYIVKTDKSCAVKSHNSIEIETAPVPLAFADNKENNIIEKYYDLDEHGKRMVDLILNEEYLRCTKDAKTSELHIAAVNGITATMTDDAEKLHNDVQALIKKHELPK